MKLTDPTTCKLDNSRPQKVHFYFEHKGFQVFDVDPPTTDQVNDVSDTSAYQEQQKTDAQIEEVEDQIQVSLFKHRILVFHFKRGSWGDWNADLIAVTEAKEIENIVAPRLAVIVRCMIRNGGPRMALNYVGYFLPNPVVARHRSSGICFWYDPFSVRVSDETKPATNTLPWPIYNPDPKEIAASHVLPELLPIRLIDIEGTLNSNGGIYFIKPTSWSFHTISHTWSKGVRDFSVAVGKKVSSAESYNRAFEDAKFLDEPSKEARDCYSHLMDFLRLLQEDGANAVWFDALCINQENNDEKAREIAGMGEYYECSLGCYVLSHGVGMGFTLWAPSGKVKLPAEGQCALADQRFQEKPALPRWFHRVWTLQEFMLPPKLTFIVAGLAKVTIGQMNRFIRQGGGPGLCMCGLPTRHPYLRCSNINLRLADEEEDIICPEQGKKDACTTCGHVPFIRKLLIQNKVVYLVDREAYCFLCQLDLGPSDHWNLKPMHTDPEFVLWSLNASAFARHGQRRNTTATTLLMLRDRDCTNEEDRVLGALGLLRYEKAGQLQVRTGTSLHAQMWRLHKTVGSLVFLKLCMMDVEGHSAVGMSWAPQLDKPLHPHASLTGLKGDLNMPILDTSLMLRVFDEGPRQGIFIVASILSAQFIPEEQVMLCNRFDPLSDLSQRMSRKFDAEVHKVEAIVVAHDEIGEAEGGYCRECAYHSPACKHLIRQCKLEVESAKSGHLEFQLAAHEGGCSNRAVVRICNAAKGGGMLNADFRIVLTGVVSVSAVKPFAVQLVRLVATCENVFGLVCIARRDEQNREMLHKIGTFSCALLDNWSLDADAESSFVMQDPGFPQIRKEIIARDPLFRPLINHSCLIGGFGNDLSKYVCS